MKRLTDVVYWEENWWKGQRPKRLWLYRDFDFETVCLLRVAGRLNRSTAETRRARVLEAGAGGSLVLPYLARKFGCRIFGSDFSLSGCRLLRSNAALVGVECGVVREDLFQSSLRPKSFDLVYSSGLVEHFDDTRAAVAEHLRLLKPGGQLVLIVPNLQGVQGRIWKRLAPPLWERHRVFGPAELADLLKTLGMESVRSGYLGSFYIGVGCDGDWSRVQAWPRWVALFVHASMRLANGLVSLFFRLSPLRPHSRALSPAFFAVAKKPEA